MEQQPHNPDEHEVRESLPGRSDHDTSGPERPPDISVEFGHLNLIPPEGVSWGEWVITRSIAEAEREKRTIDHRTARYIAAFLGQTATPALRRLATTGAIDLTGMQEEITSLHASQTDQVQGWMAWLAHYCASWADRGPVEDWQQAIDQQDRADAERLRHERVLEIAEEYFEVLPVHDPETAGERDLFAAIRYIDHLGGLILHRRAAGGREVWATDSEIELAERWAEIVERSPELPEQGWIMRLPTSEGDAEEQAATPEAPPPSPAR